MLRSGHRGLHDQVCLGVQNNGGVPYRCQASWKLLHNLEDHPSHSTDQVCCRGVEWRGVLHLALVMSLQRPNQERTPDTAC